MEAPLSRKIVSYCGCCCRLSRLVKNVDLLFQSYVRVYECTHGSCVLKPLIKMFGWVSFGGHRCHAFFGRRLLIIRTHLFRVPFVRRALTLLSYAQLRQSVSAQTNTISWPADTLPPDIFWHQSLRIPLFFFWFTDAEGGEAEEGEGNAANLTCTSVGMPDLSCFSLEVFGSVLTPERYPTARVVGGWSWLYCSCKNKQRVGKCAVCC